MVGVPVYAILYVMRSITLFTAFLTVLPVQNICAQNTWDRVFDGSQALSIQSITPPPAPVSDVEAVGARVTLLLNADLSNQRAPVWPGYSVFGQPVLLYEAGLRSFLIAHPNPPAGYNAVFSSPRTVFEKQGVISDLNFAFQFHRNINGIDSFAYRYQTGDKPERDVHTIIHERFHIYQEKGFAATQYGQRASEPDAEDLALAALEQRALKSALQAAAPAESARFARQFLAVRAERYTRLPDSGDVETDQERTEGMAQYIEENLMARPDVAPVPGGVIPLITRRLDRFPTIDDMEKGRYYATGAAQGLLLDRAGHAGWKELVSAGAAPHELLALSYPMSSGTGQALLAEAKAEHGYNDLLRTGKQVAADFQSLKAGAISDYENSPGIEWKVPVPWDKETNFGFSGTNPDFKLNGRETLMPHLHVLDVSGKTFTLHFEDRPAVLGSGVRFHAAASAAVLIDGVSLPLSDGVYPFGTLSLSETGLNLSITKSGTLTVTGRKAVITYLEKSFSRRSLLEKRD